ncbi:MAG: LCP family protein [Oscillospiraceae bacterium]|nr:LCP family protein [Oscillospiraceae bacterium]
MKKYSQQYTRMGGRYNPVYPQYAPKRRRRKNNRIIPLLLIILMLLVLIAHTMWQKVFVRPEIPASRDDETAAVSPSANGQMDAVQSGDLPPDGDTIDYGEGIRPRQSGERKSDDFYTVLVLGRDTGGGGNTDTMLLVSYDVTNQKANVMSIPRDTMINVPWDVKKINSVYSYFGGGEKGIQQVYKEVSQLVGFQPDFKVVVEWDAVKNIVDAIGGVWFDNPYPMDYHDPKQNLVIEQEQGYRLLTGEDAMQVIRWRANDNDSPYGYRKKNGGIGDDGRIKLQQDFLKAMFRQVLTIQNVRNLNKIAKVCEENVDTDLTFQNMLWFAQKAFMGGLGMEDIDFFTMPWYGASVWSRSYKQNLSYVCPQGSKLLEIVNTKLSPFAADFEMSDLDIMSVRSNGTLRSSTGHVEDREATKVRQD